MTLDEKQLAEWKALAHKGHRLSPADTLALLDEVGRLQGLIQDMREQPWVGDPVAEARAVALTFEDEADRVGLELKAARDEVRRLKELLNKDPNSP